MRSFLVSLLDLLETSYPNSLTIEQLYSKDVSFETISIAFERKLITFPKESNFKPFNNTSVNLGGECNLTNKGFELLNYTKLEESLEQLDGSIIKFNKSSDNASRILIKYSKIMMYLTIFIGMIAVIQVVEYLEEIINRIILGIIDMIPK
ncbi:MAG: hypothetical protein KAT05_03260 [Spirochaetes bacterium]|nr:hypothetical protein [Spirochaetota bacterium]